MPQASLPVARPSSLHFLRKLVWLSIATAVLVLFGSFPTPAFADTGEHPPLYLADQGSPSQPILFTDNSTASVSLAAATNGVAISPDGKTLYYASFQSRSVSIVDSSSLEVVSTIDIEGHAPYIGTSALAVSADGQKLFVGGSDGFVTIIDIDTKSVVLAEHVGEGDQASIYGVAISPDGTQLIALDRLSNRMLILDPTDLRVIKTISMAVNPTSIKFSSDGSFAYVAYDVPKSVWDAALTGYSTESWEPVTETTPSELGIAGRFGLTDIVLSPDGTEIYALTYSSWEVVKIDASTFGAISVTDLRPESSALGGSIQISPSGETLFVSSKRTVQEIAVADMSLSSPVTVGSTLWSSKVAPDQPAVASFAHDDSAQVDDSVTFDASKTSFSTSPVATYEWDFGDGSTLISTTPVVTHNYRAAGEYSVTLTTTTSGGTSISVVFNGQSVTRNGSGSAAAQSTITVSEAAPENPGIPETPDAPKPPDTPLPPTAPEGSEIAHTGEPTLSWLWPLAAISITSGIILLLWRRRFTTLRR